MRTNPPYYGIKVFFPSGNGYWLTDKDDEISLVFTEELAKVFLTVGSGERYIAKLIEKFPVASGIFSYVVCELKGNKQ